MIVFKVSVLDSTTQSPVVGAAVKETVSWGGGAYVLEPVGHSNFQGTTDGNGNYEISLSDIGLGDSPYSITGSVSANGYYTTNFSYAAITGNADGHTISKTVYLTQNLSIGGTSPSPTSPSSAVNDIYGGATNLNKSISSSEPIVIWIIALVIIIAVVVLFFVLRGKMGGASKPRAVIY